MDERFGQMDPKMPPQDDNAELRHAYQTYEGSPHWRSLNAALSALVENGDLQETTNRVYIVGYLCQALAGIVVDEK